ncbi:MAG: hypothetical protein H6838_18875 [Planctomycetes bacterium]|nr:hypothetical protein [Planctomycetota bacterium]
MAAPAVAQRAACTGTLLEPDGTPVGAARVTFVQEVSQALGGTPDRIEVRSDEHGAFAAELLLGSPYVVWAIGPRDANGAHLVTTATMQAVAGKRIELRANRRAAPRAIAVRGAAPWVVDAPPALRALVGGQYACGEDVVLPGDGVVKLGPLPDEPIELALVDGDGQILDFAMLVEGTPASVTFLPTQQFECLVVDQDGVPIAGAAIWTPAESRNWSRGCDPLPRGSVCGWRRAGVTDAQGQATIRLPWAEEKNARAFRLLASREGYAADTGGVLMGSRLLRQRGEVPDEERFEFRLTTRDPTRMRLDALPGAAAVAFVKTRCCARQRRRSHRPLGSGRVRGPGRAPGIVRAASRDRRPALLPAAACDRGRCADADRRRAARRGGAAAGARPRESA